MPSWGGGIKLQNNVSMKYPHGDEYGSQGTKNIFC